MTILDSLEHDVSAGLTKRHQTEWGQYFTPSGVARFMAGLFATSSAPIKLLDPGAGTGSLSAAFLDILQERLDIDPRVELTVYERDVAFLPHLSARIENHRRRLTVNTVVIPDDFIEGAVNQLQFRPLDKYTHAILNPPYKKITADSRQRRLLRQVGIETVNLYAAFVALAIALLEPEGQLVAITPRSFCNGPYYRSFREYILKNCAIHHIHLFEARDKAFGEDRVLQENIIFLLAKRTKQGDVTISTSLDHHFYDYQELQYPFERIILKNDPERFIHIPMAGTEQLFQRSHSNRYLLQDIGVEVSTGPIVDFRLREHLRAFPEAGSAPLFYPNHFVGHLAKWPLSSSKKPNAIMVSPETRQWLLPTGFYTVARRFSSKEEPRRLVASLVTPEKEYGPLLGFENHLNVFHAGRSGLPELLARGLTIYLNSTEVDIAFRQFSGHTQVNATDLRNMLFPSRDALVQLGLYAKDKQLGQDEIDQIVEGLV
jgi:tRNA1(Val) A37 N6-methylase TrmN6